MRRIQIIAKVLLLVFSAVNSNSELCADDPLNAYPTFEDTVEDKINRLTEAQKKSLRFSEKDDQLIFCYTRGAHFGDRQNADLDLEPLVRVFADGRIDCGSLFLHSSDRRMGKLTKHELVWLMHLVINECQLFDRTTQDIEESYRNQTGSDAIDSKQTRRFMYRLSFSARENDLSIPNAAIVLRPLRKRMQLGAFASLDKYTNFLVARVWLGESDERQLLLEQLNRYMNKEHPTLPAFRMEHLGAASQNVFEHDLSATFQQEIMLKKNTYKSVRGHIKRKAKDGDPVFLIYTNEYRRSRPSP